MGWTREDAAKENDGDRLIRVCRFDLLRFAMSNHTKYRLLAFRLQAQLMALLPFKLAFELKRTIGVSMLMKGRVVTFQVTLLWSF